MKIDVILIDIHGEFKRVIMKGPNDKANMYLWRYISSPPKKEEIDISDYVSLRKFFRETNPEVTADRKTKLFSSIVLHAKPKNTYSIWCHKDSEIGKEKE